MPRSPRAPWLSSRRGCPPPPRKNLQILSLPRGLMHFLFPSESAGSFEAMLGSAGPTGDRRCRRKWALDRARHASSSPPRPLLALVITIPSSPPVRAKHCSTVQCGPYPLAGERSESVLGCALDETPAVPLARERLVKHFSLYPPHCSQTLLPSKGTVLYHLLSSDFIVSRSFLLTSVSLSRLVRALARIWAFFAYKFVPR